MRVNMFHLIQYMEGFNMRKFFNSKITKVVLTILIVALLYLYMCCVFMPKNPEDRGFAKYYNTRLITKEAKNSVDIIFYGNSDLSSGIVPMQIFKEQGYTSFLRWGNQQTLNTVYQDVKDDFKIQQPKLVVLEVDCVYYPNKSYSNNDFYESYVLTPFMYHSRWKSIDYEDFIGKTDFQRDYHKGYNYQTINGHYVYEDYMGTSTEIEPIEKSVLQKVKQIKKLCDKNNAQLLFIEAPSPSSWSMQKHNGIKQLAEELDVKFIDFNFELEGFDFDYANDFRDYGNHCNFNGATKVTRYVANFIKENYNIPDRRLDDDAKYITWKEDVLKYDKVYSK